MPRMTLSCLMANELEAMGAELRECTFADMHRTCQEAQENRSLSLHEDNVPDIGQTVIYTRPYQEVAPCSCPCHRPRLWVPGQP